MAANTYEGMFILDSNRYSRDPSSIPQQISTILEKLDGEVLASRLWDDGRKLAYPIDGHKKGTYWLTYFKLEGARVGELNRECQLNDNMVRHMFIKLDPRVADVLVRAARGEAAPEPEPEATPENSAKPQPAAEPVGAGAESES